MTTPEIGFNNQALVKAISGSVAENARNLGISRQHLNNILKGRKQPSGILLLKIQSLYKLSADKITKKIR